MRWWRVDRRGVISSAGTSARVAINRGTVSTAIISASDQSGSR